MTAVAEKAAASENIVEFERVTKTFYEGTSRAFTAIKDVSFTVENRPDKVFDHRTKLGEPPRIEVTGDERSQTGLHDGIGKDARVGKEVVEGRVLLHVRARLVEDASEQRGSHDRSRASRSGG